MDVGAGFWAIVIAGLLSCGGDTVVFMTPDVPDSDTSDSSLLFGPVVCDYELLGLAGLAVGQSTSCGFDVTGEVGRSVVLTCEQNNGEFLPCTCEETNCNEDEQIIPFRATFVVHGNAPPNLVLRIRGNDSSTETEAFVDVPVTEVNVNGIDDAPELVIDCDGDRGLFVSHPAGTPLTCRVLVSNGDDLDDIQILVIVASGPGTAEEWIVVKIAPYAQTLVLFSKASDAGQTTTIWINAVEYSGSSTLDDSVELQVDHI